MTYKGFLKALEALAVTWNLGPGGEIRTKMPPPRSPLTAVCAARTECEYRPDQWNDAAVTRGLLPAETEAIHIATEAILPYARDIRLVLLGACRITVRPRQGTSRASRGAASRR